MPNTDGTLTQAELDLAKDWLIKKTKNGVCPVCSTNEWDIGAHLLHGQIFRGGNLVIGGPAYPQMFIVCRTCAYVRSFMAVQIGIVSAAPPEAVDEKKAG